MRLGELAWIGGLLLTACSSASSGGSGASGAAGTSGDSGSSGVVATGGRWGAGAWGGGGASGGGASAGGGMHSGGSTAVGGAAPVVAACPHDPPSAGGPCGTGLSCSYGDDPRASCRTRYDCLGAAWVATAGTCASITACGSLAQVPADGATCVDVGANCWTLADAYNYNVACACPACSGAMCSSMWSCGGAPAPGCPRVIPNLGQPCDSTTPAKCVYGVCPDSTAAVCQSGAWTWASMCPIAAP